MIATESKVQGGRIIRRRLFASQRVRGAGWVGGFCDFWHSQYYKIGILLDCSTPETPMSQYFNGSGQRKRTFWVDCNEIHISNLDVNQRLPRHPYEGIGSLGSLGVSGVSESRESRESRESQSLRNVIFNILESHIFSKI